MSGILFPTALSYHQLWQVLSASYTPWILCHEPMMLRFYYFLLFFLLLGVPVSRDVVLGIRIRTRTRQTRSKLPDADVSALIFLKCNDMSCVWHASTSTSTRRNCLLSHCKHETISRVWVFNSVSNVFVFGSKRRFMHDLQLQLLVLADTVFLLESNVRTPTRQWSRPTGTRTRNYIGLVYSKHLWLLA